MYFSGRYPLFKRFKVTIKIPVCVIVVFVLTKGEIVAAFIQYGTVFY
jgi:hypothetical protein